MAGPTDQFDPEQARLSCAAEVKSLAELFQEGTEDRDHLEDLVYFLEQDKIGNGTAFSLVVEGVSLRINARDNVETACSKINFFTAKVREKKSAVTPPSEEAVEVTKAVDGSAGEMAAAVKSVVKPLVPGKDKTYWRDVIIEILLVTDAFKGTPYETKMRDLRKILHKKALGKEDFNIVFGRDVLEIWEGDGDEEMLTKLTRFVEAVKRHNPDKFMPPAKGETALPETTAATPAPAAVAPSAEKGKAKSEKDKVYWRDIISGIDALCETYPDEDFSALQSLREMLEAGEVGQGMHLFLSIGDIHLWIKKIDDDDMIKEKIAIFIGELKQMESITEPTSESLDPALDKTYWRDIAGALADLESVYGENSDFQILKLAIETGTLGTVKDFHAIIGGVKLEIKQSDTDVGMRDKLTKFIKDLTKEGEVKISAESRKKHQELENKYRKLESEKEDLRSRYEKAGKTTVQQKDEIKRLESANRKYEEKIRKLEEKIRELQGQVSTPAPSPRSYRSYSG